MQVPVALHRNSTHGGLNILDGLAGGEVDGKVLDDRHSRTRRVIEVDVLERDLADTFLRLETVGGRGVNSRNAIDGLVELSRGTAGLCDLCISGARTRKKEAMRIVKITLTVQPALTEVQSQN